MEEYSGHAGTGGLQRHSIGGPYPYIIVATGHGKWYWRHAISGHRAWSLSKTYDGALVAAALNSCLGLSDVSVLFGLIPKPARFAWAYGGEVSELTADTRRLIYEFITRGHTNA